MKKRESPDFSSPEVGISVIGWPVRKLIFLLVCLSWGVVVGDVMEQN